MSINGLIVNDNNITFIFCDLMVNFLFFKNKIYIVCEKIRLPWKIVCQNIYYLNIFIKKIKNFF
jgi:hypothetical protein